MKAAVYQGAGQGFAIEDVPDVAPEPHEVVIKVGACGICGSDLHTTSGEGLFQKAAGAIMGHEFAGEVVAVGGEARRLSVGDRITALPLPTCGECPACRAGEPRFCTGREKSTPRFGGFAEYMAIPEYNAVPIPESMPFHVGALVEPSAVGFHAAVVARVTPGARVLILGAGPIGLAVAYFARRLGAGRIAVLATSERRRRYAEAVGVDDFLVSKGMEADEAGDGMVITPGADGEAVRDAMGGRPEIVFEAAGVAGSTNHAMRIVRSRGTVVSMGWSTHPETFTPALMQGKQIAVQFSTTYGIADFLHVVDALENEEMGPKALVSGRISLDEMPDVFETLRGRSPHCKVVVDMSL